MKIYIEKVKVERVVNETLCKSGWGTVADADGDFMLGDIDYDLLWDHIYNWK